MARITGWKARVCMALCVVVTAVCWGAAAAELVLVPSDTAHSGGVNSTAPLHANVTTFPALAGKGRNGYLSVYTHAAPYFSVQAASPTCAGLVKTSVQAAAHNCTYATNAGPFKSLSTGGCIGAVISEGRVEAAGFGGTYTMFGVTEGGQWALGVVRDQAHARTLRLTQLVTGFNWLVKNGTSVVPTPGGEAAPRTAVGVDAEGRLMLLEVDGCEKCPEGKGPTMHELAHFLASPEVAAQYAVNLDGGGSSTFVEKGVVVNFPTCMDIDYRCERPVSTIMCISAP